MGMPISLALRGRHTDDDAAPTPGPRSMAELRGVDRVFSTYRPDSSVSRLGRGEIGLADCPPEVAEVLRLGRGGRAGLRRGVQRPAAGRRTARPCWIPAGW